MYVQRQHCLYTLVNSFLVTVPKVDLTSLRMLLQETKLVLLHYALITKTNHVSAHKNKAVLTKAHAKLHFLPNAKSYASAWLWLRLY